MLCRMHWGLLADPTALRCDVVRYEVGAVSRTRLAQRYIYIGKMVRGREWTRLVECAETRRNIVWTPGFRQSGRRAKGGKKQAGVRIQL